MKTCTKCKVEKPATVEYFYTNKRHKNGLKSWCKVCWYKQQCQYRQTSGGKAIRKRMQKKADVKSYNTIDGYLGRVYNSMNQRCNSKKYIYYKDYGGRGIRNKFKSLDSFRDYVKNVLRYIVRGSLRGLQIDRINNDGNYEPGNIRFVTRRANMNNRRKGCPRK